MKYIEDIDVLGKKVILRLDLNVTIDHGNIIDETKIKKSIPTIKYLLNHGAHVLIMSHLGKIKNEKDKENNSLKVVCNRLSELLEEQILFIDDPLSEQLQSCLEDNCLVMMENTRFLDYPDKRESGCDDELAKFWASLGDVFINDAFGMTHRRHASNCGIAKYLPSGYGFLINEELVGLEPIINNVQKPFVVVMGGAKVDDKIKLISSLLEECDYLLVGGGIANTFLRALGYNIGNSLCSYEYLEEVRNLCGKYSEKLVVPTDVIVEDSGVTRRCYVNEITNDCTIFDIGDDTIFKYEKYIQLASTIFQNGTMGKYEDENYRNGTESLFKMYDQSDAIIIAGGGDAVAAVNTLGYEKAFDFLSTGGGATLEYIATKKLKCFEGDKNDSRS